MNQALEALAEQISARFGDKIARAPSRCDELTFELDAGALREVCLALRDEPEWSFEQLTDLCGIDYLHHGRSEWNTDTATFRGFSRGVDRGTRGALAFERGEVAQTAPEVRAAASLDRSRSLARCCRSCRRRRRQPTRRRRRRRSLRNRRKRLHRPGIEQDDEST